MKKATNYTSFRDTFWFLPALYNVIAVVVTVVTISGDYRLTSSIEIAAPLLVNTDLAVTILATLAGAILTMTTITFSTIMVVLSTYSSQFSPRVLQNFIADRPIQHVLAIFSSGFTYTLIALLFMNKNQTQGVILSPFVGIVWGLLGTAAFVFIIHHTATWMQINNLIGHLVTTVEATIERVTRREITERRAELTAEDSRALRGQGGQPVPAPVSGYAVLIDLPRLFERARQDNAVVEMQLHIGAYAMQGVPIMSVYGDREADIDPARYADCVHFGNEQADWQDIAFGLRKIVEIAVRAISPSINDPYTAATCTNRLAPLLTMLAQRDQRVSAFYDDEGDVRLIARDFRFEDYLFNALHEIRYYGKSDLTVISALLDSLTNIARGSPEGVHEVLWRFGVDTTEAFVRSDPVDAARAEIVARLEALAEATAHGDAFGQLQLESPSQAD